MLKKNYILYINKFKLLIDSHKNITSFYYLPKLPERSELLKEINSMAKRHKNDDTSKIQSKKPRLNKHWSLGLLDSMQDKELQIYEDDLAVIIKDKYPKAKHHYLILPKDNITSLKKLNKTHIKLLEHMDQIGHILIQEKHKNVAFKFGYHAEASMQRLHMHVISDDMSSDCLKTKKHWNSFNTEFFIDAKVILEDLRKNEKINLYSSVKCKEYMDSPLKCHKCDYLPKNMPTLKNHILSHINKQL